MQVDGQLKKDVAWWRVFLPTYNGVSIAWMEQCPEPDHVISCDASPKGVGGYLTDLQYFALQVPPAWQGVNIAYLELWAIVFTLHAWGAAFLKGKRVVIKCDNKSVVAVLTNGHSRDLFLQAGMHKVAFLLAQVPCELKVVPVSTRENRMTDLLSHWTAPLARGEFKRFARECSLKHVRMYSEQFKFINDW